MQCGLEREGLESARVVGRTPSCPDGREGGSQAVAIEMEIKGDSGT